MIRPSSPLMPQLLSMLYTFSMLCRTFQRRSSFVLKFKHGHFRIVYCTMKAHTRCSQHSQLLFTPVLASLVELESHATIAIMYALCDFTPLKSSSSIPHMNILPQMCHVLLLPCCHKTFVLHNTTNFAQAGWYCTSKLTFLFNSKYSKTEKRLQASCRTYIYL